MFRIPLQHITVAELPCGSLDVNCTCCSGKVQSLAIKSYSAIPFFCYSAFSSIPKQRKAEKEFQKMIVRSWAGGCLVVIAQWQIGGSSSQEFWTQIMAIAGLSLSSISPHTIKHVLIIQLLLTSFEVCMYVCMYVCM